jgi:CHAD domain-containing protein
MKEQQVKKIIQNYLGSLSEMGTIEGAGLERDGIHDFRVTVKKLRAFLRLLQSAHEGPGLTKQFKRTYRITGAIRDTQLELEQVQQLHIVLPGYTSHLEQVISQQRIAWDNNHPERSIKRLKRKLLQAGYGDFANDALYHFLYEKTKTVGRILSRPSVSDDQLHEVRKQIKDAVYATELCAKKWKAAWKKAGEPDAGELKKMGEKIGEYNDRRILVAHMNSFAAELEGSGEKKTIERATAAMAKELTAARKEVLAALRAYVAATTATAQS